MPENDPRRLERHFAFGENWQSFLVTITDESIAEARRGLGRLVEAEEIAGRSFLDIGCGSGLSMLAAAQLGAGQIVGFDIDPNSVAAASSLLSRYLPQRQWSVRTASVFDLAPDRDGRFDIVHSWGVLHHTGDLDTALRKAADMVTPGGRLVLALYRKTPFCGLWRIEKRIYSRAGRFGQGIIRGVYKTVLWAALAAIGRHPLRYVRQYRSGRGMDWAHEVHDWLGGYPYQSTSPSEVAAHLAGLGFTLVRVFEKPVAAAGLFGSHCDEFVAVRAPQPRQSSR